MKRKTRNQRTGCKTFRENPFRIFRQLRIPVLLLLLIVTPCGRLLAAPSVTDTVTLLEGAPYKPDGTALLIGIRKNYAVVFENLSSFDIPTEPGATYITNDLGLTTAEKDSGYLQYTVHGYENQTFKITMHSEEIGYVPNSLMITAKKIVSTGSPRRNARYFY